MMTNQLGLNDYKQGIANLYNRRSQTYDDSKWHVQICQCLLEYAQVSFGQHVLDIATGTGHIAIAASQIVGSEGRVIGIDISAGMLEQTRNKVEALGLKNIDFQLADAESVNLPANSFHPSGSPVAHGGNPQDRAGSPNIVCELISLDRGQRSCITTLASISQTWWANWHSYTCGHS